MHWRLLRRCDGRRRRRCGRRARPLPSARRRRRLRPTAAGRRRRRDDGGGAAPPATAPLTPSLLDGSARSASRQAVGASAITSADALRRERPRARSVGPPPPVRPEAGASVPIFVTRRPSSSRRAGRRASTIGCRPAGGRAAGASRPARAGSGAPRRLGCESNRRARALPCLARSRCARAPRRPERARARAAVSVRRARGALRHGCGSARGPPADGAPLSTARRSRRAARRAVHACSVVSPRRTARGSASSRHAPTSSGDEVFASRRS